MKKGNKNLLEGALAGAVFGAAAALLLAPMSGKKLRNDIKKNSADFYKTLAPKLKKLKTLSESEYQMLVKTAAMQYAKAKKMSKNEADELVKEAKSSWKELKKLGKLYVVVLSGIFLDVQNAEVDMLLVGDVRKGNLEKVLKRFERELGKDIVYAVLAPEEFTYRCGMHDRFLRQLFDQPHETIIDTMGLVNVFMNGTLKPDVVTSVE